MELPYRVSLYVIAAICGNFWQESTINPGLYEGRKVVPILDETVYGGFGLGQWTNSTAHGVYRRTELGEWLLKNGYEFDDGYGQLEFLIYENTWYDNGVAAEYNSLTDFLQSDSENIDLLVEQYMVGWEGIRDLSLPTRIEAAHKCYDYIMANLETDPGGWITNNEYLSEADRLHNALIVYKIFRGYVPGKKDKNRKRPTLVPILCNPLRRRLRWR